ncbi:uncharacterized protein LOC120275370 [Dioscorea cayenensis subsp. rotundata]|uniref:Uncharacterized protein LOC120275370 n=1 Tax=Dioscorea cayennensis subsp. rotundata TaxID=55577 RepID=A0AB40CHX9_DIOCR|nr:uncharacterized protein LOC120275370 [Dioscorea cayenensis subsp. rotundata]XP_039137852.1 uncharacterized protein LOC120275370 [Dioscorea cayenensis subsp. rotundata]XP_039137853.1 uncharacterized protein LOC120275370 [Dioscorea cayenensis subsp. rotundata]
MTEVVSQANIERKRRLPAWMSTDKDQKKSENDNTKVSESEERSSVQISQSKAKSTTRKRDREILRQERGDLVVFETAKNFDLKGENKESNSRNEGPNNSFSSCGKSDLLKNRKKKGKKKFGECEKTQFERAVPGKQDQKSGRCEVTEIKASLKGSSDDEIDLSVEDLKSIAKEYACANTESQHVRLALRKTVSGLDLSSSLDSKFDSGAYLTTATAFNKTLTKCTRSSSQIIGNEVKDKDSPAVENFSCNIARTGDAAQDMLELFLGPLLKGGT